MKRFVEGMDRGQSTLFPECLERPWSGPFPQIRGNPRPRRVAPMLHRLFIVMPRRDVIEVLTKLRV